MPLRHLPTVPPRPATRPARISFEEIPTWVPGEIVCAADDLGWKDVAQRSYRYRGEDVEIPPPDCFMLVHYRDGATPMDRCIDGRWTRTHCASGHFSLLSQAADSHWHWTEDLVVSHVYLREGLMQRVAADLMGGPVDTVQLHDVLDGTDPIVVDLLARITHEADAGAPGHALAAEAMGLQLAVHLLRHYADCRVRGAVDAGALTLAQQARLRAYVEAHLAGPIALQDLAQALDLGPCTLNRRLRATLGVSAYRYVIDRRVERAHDLLVGTTTALKDVASACGFADQAHLTRTLRAHRGVTPGRLRSR